MVFPALFLGIFCFVYGIFIVAASGFLTPSNYIWFLLAGGCFFLSWWSQSYLKEPRKIPLSSVVALHVLAILGLLIFISVQILVFLALPSHKEQALDYMVVLGAPFGEQGPTGVLAERLDTAAEYALENPWTKVVVSGGQPKGGVTEAQVMASYLIDKGVDPEQILAEMQSKNTRENLLYSMALIQKDVQDHHGYLDIDIGSTSGPVFIAEDKPKKIGVFTSDFHIFRASMLSRRLNYSQLYFINCPSDPLLYLNRALRETAAILKDKFFGYF